MHMTIDEKVQRTLAELGVNDAARVGSLFAEVQELFLNEQHEMHASAGKDEHDIEKRWKEVRDRWLSRKRGIITQIDEKWLKPSPREIRPFVGQRFNDLRTLVTSEIGRDPWGGLGKPIRTVYVEPTELPPPRREMVQPHDLTLPGYRRSLGSVHPITRVQREIEDIFLNLGFRIETGPEVESVYYNFDALNIPETHPARDDVDSLYVDAKTVLRTHTSPVQIRAMEKYGAPLYIIVPGRVYRRDNPDASHSPMFHQIEGLAVDTDITFADLKGTLDHLAKKFFGGEVRTIFHPTFFPFTEPSGQMAISCVICDGRGCRTCKESGWIEVMGCGMVHPEVLRHGGIEPDRYSGWAFGFGTDRFAMMKYNIDDIQLFFQNDLRFLEQF